MLRRDINRGLCNKIGWSFQNAVDESINVDVNRLQYGKTDINLSSIINIDRFNHFVLSVFFLDKGELKGAIRTGAIYLTFFA